MLHRIDFENVTIVINDNNAASGVKPLVNILADPRTHDNGNGDRVTEYRQIWTGNLMELADELDARRRWITRHDIDEAAPSFDTLARQTMIAYREYFQRGHRGELEENNMETLTREMEARFGAFCQVRKMGTPEASLVVYGSRAAWYNNLNPVAILPFDENGLDVDFFGNAENGRAN